MSNAILIMGASGTGKSSSIESLDPKSTFIISVLTKDLPFKGYKKKYVPITGWDDTSGNFFATDEWQKIVHCIGVVSKSRPEITTIVIDDLQYVLANEFMRRSSEKGYEKFSEMAMHYWQIINTALAARSDLLTVFLSHNEFDVMGQSKIKTIGKLLDEKITIEGMFTIVLHSNCKDGRYYFTTQNDGILTAKSPRGMFTELQIENNLLTVKTAISNYYNGE